uniref:Putative secreted protein n=1 Tax=Ixodes ricinus TaxID=34613 RepID=A0A6B0UR24_IXORI
MVFFILCYFALLLESRVLAPSCPHLGSPLTGPGCWHRKSLSCSCDVSTVPPVRGWRPASAMPTADRCALGSQHMSLAAGQLGQLSQCLKECIQAAPGVLAHPAGHQASHHVLHGGVLHQGGCHVHEGGVV